MIKVSFNRRGRVPGGESVPQGSTAPHEEPSADAEPVPSGATGESWTRRNELLRQASTIGLWGLILSGPAALSLYGAQALRPAVAAAPVVSSSTEVDERGRVSLFARDAVVAVLSAKQGEESTVKAWVPMAVGVLPAKAPQVSDPLLVSADEVSPHRWSVRLAVGVNGQRQYLQLPVAFDPVSGSATALAEPQPVSGVPVGSRSDDPLRRAFPLTSDLGKTLGGFVSAYAAGQGDITRYTAPGTTIQAIAPAPYRTVKLTNLKSDVAIPLDRLPREGGTAQVLIAADATTADKVTQHVSWVVTVKVRAARWEIASLDSVPGVRPAALRPAAAGTPDPSAGTSAPAPK